MTTYLSSWWPTFPRTSENETEQVANDEPAEASGSRDQPAKSEDVDPPKEDAKRMPVSIIPDQDSLTPPTVAQDSSVHAASGRQPPSENAFKVPALPTRSSAPKQHVASSSSLVPPPVPLRQPAPGRHIEEDIDAAPQFPLPDSAQRSRASNPSKPAPAPVPSFDVRPPSPDQDEDDIEPASDLNIAVLPGTIPLGNMAPPPSTTARPAFGMQAPSAPASKTKRREKVALGPGYSPLDWARLTQSGRNLRGVDGPKRVTVEELQKHNTAYDAWMALDGIVYNITPYVRFHPGGGKELLRGAGRDGTKLFMNTHSWVNYTHMLQECIVGPLVRS